MLRAYEAMSLVWDGRLFGHLVVMRCTFYCTVVGLYEAFLFRLIYHAVRCHVIFVTEYMDESVKSHCPWYWAWCKGHWCVGSDGNYSMITI